ncbi:hypothetical protein [Rothia dentocariosa]|uniref:hypothetical protein n=1 Tax=Rothia dentocariosa TaxID=2047 RepID=UPI003C7153A5
MDFRFEAPPQLELGQPIGYYNERFNKDLHDSSFPGSERFQGRVALGGAERVVDLGLAEGKVVLFSLQILDGDTLDGVSLGLSPREFHEKMRIEGHDSSIFSERLIFFEDFLTLGCEGKNIEFIEWWDRGYWDDYSFLEEAYPNT